jgi:hypothetical protein
MENGEQKNSDIPDPPGSAEVAEDAHIPDAALKPVSKPDADPGPEIHAETDMRQERDPQPEPHTEQPHPEIAMEVHHHPDLHHRKKPWKEYLLEGLMIFIAVMMGFIAENIREDITNSRHAHELTAQLVADLKTDTAHLNKVIAEQTKIRQANDSLFILLQEPLATADLNKIQRLIINSHNLWTFHPAGGAIGAIKNELHLKQFGHSQLISYIADYESGIDLLHTAQDVCLEYQHNMLDGFLRAHFTPGNLLAAFDHKALPDVHMRDLSQAVLTQLAADMVLIRVVSDEIVRDDKSVKEKAVSLLNYTISEYDLEK